MIRNIARYPDPILRKVCAPVEQIDDNIRAICQDLLDTMNDRRALGIAAPQIHIPLRIIAISTPQEMVLINPKIIYQNDMDMVHEEGCLSLGTYVRVSRAGPGIEVSAMNLQGENITLSVTYPATRVIQHEIDHLDGKLTIDHLNPKEKREVIRLLANPSRR